MAKKKRIVYPVVFMVALTAFYTFALAFINETTVDRIKANELLDIQRSVLYVLNIENDGSVEEVQEFYNTLLTFDDRGFYMHESDGQVLGYAFPYTGQGLWGSISGYIAFSSDFDKVLGLDFTAHSETPGLGGRIDEETYKEQFRMLPVDGSSTLINRPASGGNVDAITGATSTSVAVVNIVNDFIEQVLIFAEEEGLYERAN